MTITVLLETRRQEIARSCPAAGLNCGTLTVSGHTRWEIQQQVNMLSMHVTSGGGGGGATGPEGARCSVSVCGPQSPRHVTYKRILGAAHS